MLYRVNCLTSRHHGKIVMRGSRRLDVWIVREQLPDGQLGSEFCAMDWWLQPLSGYKTQPITAGQFALRQAAEVEP